MTTAQDTVLVDRLDIEDSEGKLGLVTLNRPDAMNPLDWGTVKSLRTAFEELAEDDSVRAVAVTGAGRAFSAGGDMIAYKKLQRDPVDFPRFLTDIHESFSAISQYPKPYIALVNGVAVAGGIELILSCDFAIAAESAQIGDAHLNFGQMGGGGVLNLLPKIVGPSRARELILSGRLLDSTEAKEWGLVSEVVPNEQLIEAGLKAAASIAKKSPLAVTNAKRVLNSILWQGTDIHSGMQIELEATARYCITSEDAPEGLDAFAEKRKPNFKGV